MRFCESGVSRRGRALLLAALTLGYATPASAGNWGGALGASSDAVFRGLTLSDGQPSLEADLHYYADARWFAGLGATTLDPGGDEGRSLQLNGYLGYSWPISASWAARLSLDHYDYPRDAPRSLYNYDELGGTLAWSDRVFLSLAWSPDKGAPTRRGDVAGRSAIACELLLHQPLFASLAANLGVGHYDISGLDGSGYTYGNAGLGYALGALQLDVSYIATDHQAKSLFYGDTAANRWLATLLWHF
jgi:uncharacterized protein (TIGR02001 family)